MHTDKHICAHRRTHLFNFNDSFGTKVGVVLIENERNCIQNQEQRCHHVVNHKTKAKFGNVHNGVDL
jgi:hypothetical protein